MTPDPPRPDPSGRLFSCLLVEDDPGFAEMLTRVISEERGEVAVHTTLQAARDALLQGATFDLVILDHRLPDGTGYEFFPWLSRHAPAAIVIMVTGAPELAHAVELTRNGLFDYLTKPLRIEDFTACLQRARRRLAVPITDPLSDHMVGISPAIQEVAQSLRQAARHPTATVLLTGETGTGKDLAARVLHAWSFPNRQAAFVPLNCPAVPSDMFEAELFGSEKGAYTGADRRRTGLVEAAEGGTLFLDEVSEIPLPLQAKLLRFLESREYRSLGSTASCQFTGRVVAATNCSLADLVRQGRFREDLWFRLDVFSLRIPALRERLEDLDSLAEGLLQQLCQRYQRLKPHLRPDDLAALRHYAFPGNVRELRNLLERSLLKTAEDARWLQLDTAWLPRTTAPTPAPAPAPVPQSPPVDLSLLERQEFLAIAQALRDERGGIRRAALRLGITHQALLRRLQKWPELRQAGASSDPH